LYQPYVGLKFAERRGQRSLRNITWRWRMAIRPLII